MIWAIENSVWFEEKVRDCLVCAERGRLGGTSIPLPRRFWDRHDQFERCGSDDGKLGRGDIPLRMKPA